MAYATADEFRAYVKRPDSVGGDEQIEAMLEVASEWIDDYCGRSFATPGAAAARVFEAGSSGELSIDDVAEEAGLLVETGSDRSNWTTVTSVMLTPGDAAQRHRPWTGLRPLAGASLEQWVRVTAVWGWPGGVPARVRQACLLQANWFLKRKDSPYGIEGFDGAPMRVSSAGDPDVRRLLARLRRADRVLGIA